MYSCLFICIVDERRLNEFHKNVDEDSAGLLLVFDCSTRLLVCLASPLPPLHEASNKTEIEQKYPKKHTPKSLLPAKHALYIYITYEAPSKYIIIV